jgi:hypothetical protein
MKRSSSRSLQKSTISDGANVTNITAGKIHGGVHTTINHIQRGRGINRPNEYPAGSIGSDLEHRNYVRYLVQRYHRFRQADSGFGRASARFSYAVIFRNIEREFKVQTYFISDTRFKDLVEYLQQHIDRTILGKRNRKREIRNYASPEEFAAEQAAR